MTAPRIDSVRAEFRDAIHLLQQMADQLEDLHVLAYSRHRAAQEAKVRGGSRDYALDTHGDKRARDLYARTATDMHRFIGHLTSSLKEVRGYLTGGNGPSRRDPSADCTTDEVVAAMDAAARRRDRGEYSPAPLAEQPKVMSQTEWQVECEALRSAVAKVTADFQEDHQSCQVDGRRLMRRYPMNRLTPRERDAWRRSVRPDDSEKAS
jgi:hypothetical protein